VEEAEVLEDVAEADEEKVGSQYRGRVLRASSARRGRQQVSKKPVACKPEQPRSR
jgi:hypothetical protein